MVAVVMRLGEGFGEEGSGVVEDLGRCGGCHVKNIIVNINFEKANHPEQHHYDTIRTTFDHDFSRINTNQILLDSNQKFSLPHKDLIHSSLKEKKNGTALVNDW